VKIKKIIIFGQRWPISNFIFAFSTLNIKELFKNSVRKKYGKKLQWGNWPLSTSIFKQAAPKFFYK